MIYAREGLVIVALAWVLMSVFGALPFIISGDIPFCGCLFETVSGFTTTGSSILRDVEAMSYSMLFWRSFTHWVGGMGVLVFTMAVLPVSDGRAMHLMRAESPGPSVGKISSKIRDTAKILYAMYLVLTVVQTILLRLAGLPWYDALITAFGTAGTGGFSNRAASIGAYGSPAVEMITAVFMVLFGINFNVYFFLLIRHFKEAFACEEMRVYLGVIAASTLAVAGNIFHLYGNVWQSLRYSSSRWLPSLPPRVMPQQILTCGPPSPRRCWCCSCSLVPVRVPPAAASKSAVSLLCAKLPSRI